jgi:hypothetical protein
MGSRTNQPARFYTAGSVEFFTTGRWGTSFVLNVQHLRPGFQTQLNAVKASATGRHVKQLTSIKDS